MAFCPGEIIVRAWLCYYVHHASRLIWWAVHPCLHSATDPSTSLRTGTDAVHHDSFGYNDNWCFIHSVISRNAIFDIACYNLLFLLSVGLISTVHRIQRFMVYFQATFGVGAWSPDKFGRKIPQDLWPAKPQNHIQKVRGNSKSRSIIVPSCQV